MELLISDSPACARIMDFQRHSAPWVIALGGGDTREPIALGQPTSRRGA